MRCASRKQNQHVRQVNDRWSGKSTTKDYVQLTTPKDLVKNVPLAIALTRDEYASIKIAPALMEPANTTTSTVADEERGDGIAKDLIETSTLMTTLEDHMQLTTPKNLLKNVPLAIALTGDEYASIKIAPTLVDPAPTTTSTMNDEVITSDVDANIQIDEASVDPAPGTLEDTEVLILEVQDEDEVAQPKLEKSAKLLLLSAPKNIEKPKEPEENIEEPEDIDDAGTAESTTAQLVESTTISEIADNEDTEDTIDATKLVTKLFAINDTLSADYPKKSSSTVEQQSEERTKTEEDSKISEQSAEPKSDNFGASFLIETEADYVLVDADVEEFGSFTHENSAVHLQPIVQSVEIVPTHVDDPYYVNYVHHEW